MIYKLCRYKSILSIALSVVFLIVAVILDFQRGFLREVISSVLYIAGGAIAGALSYYLFLEDFSLEDKDEDFVLGYSHENADKFELTENE